MNVLSLFDGMSCGRIALERLGIKVDNYYSSEIDKYAMQVSEANYPDIIQIGDVTKINYDELPQIDLIMGGSPCQGFSFAGKQLAFDDPRSALFFCFWRAVKHLKPKYFLLENVRMKKEYLDVISEYMGVEPIMINSALVSAQNRVRYYWTNIPGVEQPEDRGIVLRDILEDGFSSERDKSYCIDANYYKGASVEQYKKKCRRQLVNKPIKVGMNVEEVKIRKHEVDEKALQKLLRSAKKESKKTIKDIAKECNVPLTKAEHWFRTDSSFAIPKDTVWIKLKFVLGITTNEFDKALLEFEYRDGVYESTQRVYSDQGKSPTLTASNKEQMIETKPKQVGGGGHREPKVLAGAFRGRYEDDGTIKQKLELRQGGKTNSLTTVQKDNVVVSTKPKRVGTIKDGSQGDRIYSQDAKGITLNAQSGGTAGSGNMLVEDKEIYWRKLTPLECMRLQTVQDDYLMPVSNSQKYKLLGNGWTIEVIAHILKNMELD